MTAREKKGRRSDLGFEDGPVKNIKEDSKKDIRIQEGACHEMSRDENREAQYAVRSSCHPCSACWHVVGECSDKCVSYLLLDFEIRPRCLYNPTRTSQLFAMVCNRFNLGCREPKAVGWDCGCRCENVGAWWVFLWRSGTMSARFRNELSRSPTKCLTYRTAFAVLHIGGDWGNTKLLVKRLYLSLYSTKVRDLLNMPFNCLVGDNTKEDTTNKELRTRIQMKNGVSRGRSHIVPENFDPRSSPSSVQGSKWDHLPVELLLDIIRLVEASETSWPARRDVVACAAVCRSWRDTVKQIIRTPEQCGLITFPMSLKQPGPRNEPIQCFIRRDRASSTYLLYLGLSPALAGDASKLLLAAKKVRKAMRTEFLISLTVDGFSRASNTYVGKLSSNFLGTKFSVYDVQPSYNSTNKPIPECGSKKVSPAVKSKVAIISYELNVLRTKGPRRMHCTMNSIPTSAVEKDGTAPTPPTFADQTDQNFSHFPDSTRKKHENEPLGSSGFEKSGPLIMRNKTPRWHEQLQCWCLNFKGRVTVASVKNFQLAVDPSQNGRATEQDDVILQFGKIGKDIFTMDYRYPLSAFQAFAICLSSFDTKPACE
ncbi:hypothetical protein L6452_39304 [Arctium lappa]|uniref:Uncharacterized protein n=1 Tax=Arctium lappa TaxID=4217 RepID=A0ACB8XW19_ARCLA|nr:hypothetical protein L6452_39304 [Arctium lappa]